MKFTSLKKSTSLITLILLMSLNPVSGDQLPYVIEEIGEYGTENGQFNQPTTVLFLGDKYYVPDYYNDRVQVFDINWNYVDQFGGSGTGLGQLLGPINLAYNGTYLFVLEYSNQRVSVFDPDGNFITTFGAPGSALGQFNGPAGISIDDGIIYISEYLGQRFQTWNESTLDPIEEVASPYSHFGIDISNGVIYIVDSTNDLVKVYNQKTLQNIGTIGTPGNGVGLITAPIGIKVVDDHMVLSDGALNKLMVLDLQGNVISESSAGFDDPYLFDISSNKLFIANTNHKITIARVTANPHNIETRTSSTGIQLSWQINQVEGIVNPNNYNIYRDDGSGARFIGNVADQVFFDHSAAIGNNYTYYVQSNSILGVGDMMSSNETAISFDDLNVATVTINEGEEESGFFAELPIDILPFLSILLLVPIIRKYKRID